ncbi:hypothetical protein CAPTEDRAFT_192755 [Capitella teleta]|uniref:Uncharacterized protein n=1 Tax=Capitella teleta TaxID=283909 RepID=R7VEK7_CAPTE|nr:hypothetical protein CAPTEDRAFT_192755 [Capitella teleta]|eukprot:ELU17069.1 hypothetical protein CAPTEDRAFT_192755 [Capitella teleta]
MKEHQQGRGVIDFQRTRTIFCTSKRVRKAPKARGFRGYAPPETNSNQGCQNRQFEHVLEPKMQNEHLLVFKADPVCTGVFPRISTNSLLMSRKSGFRQKIPQLGRQGPDHVGIRDPIFLSSPPQQTFEWWPKAGQFRR